MPRYESTSRNAATVSAESGKGDEQHIVYLKTRQRARNKESDTRPHQPPAFHAGNAHHGHLVHPDGLSHELPFLLNGSSWEMPYKVEAGDRIAQMILRKQEEAVLIEVKELAETDRGIDGFGSTGR